MSAFIRAATEGDLKPIQKCAVAAYSKYVERLGRAPAPMVADFAAAIDAGLVSVACRDGAVAGFVVFYPAGTSMHLENVAVSPEFAGFGVGRLLIEHAEAQAVLAGMKSIDLYTNEVMTENLSLYPALQYEEYKRQTEDGFRRVYFKKMLDSRADR